MPAPRWLARANRIGLNRLVGTFARHAPGFGMIVHRGRRSGRTYRTPVNVFRRDGRFIVALTYGPESDWVQNVLAAGGCELETRGRRYRLDSPQLYRDESRGEMPTVVRHLLGVLNVDYFLALHVY